MPYTGFDPRLGGEPIDPSGGGYDPSAYYSQSPGGRFRGDTQNFLDYLVGIERGTAGANPDYTVPDWAKRLPGLYGKFAQWHENNARTGGTGNAPAYPDPSLYLYSGPGARFGPPGGPLHGLLDQEKPHNWDGVDGGPPGPGGAIEEKPRRGGGGGGGQPNFVFQPYQGLNHTPSFVAWQPDRPLSEPTQFVYGQNTRQAPPAPLSPAKPTKPGGGGGGRAGGGKGPGRGSNQVPPSGTGPAGNKPSAPTKDEFDEFLRNLLGGPREPLEPPGREMRQGLGGGVDFNLLDKGTPGWMRDRTLNPNLAGNPTPETVIAPKPGQAFESYLDQLASQGYDSDTIASLLGPNGYRRGEDGNWDWGWGTGPVTRGPNGYHFANQGEEEEQGFGLFGPGPGTNRGPGGGLSLFDRRSRGDDEERRFGTAAGGLLDLVLGGGMFAR